MTHDKRKLKKLKLQYSARGFKFGSLPDRVDETAAQSMTIVLYTSMSDTMIGEVPASIKFEAVDRHCRAQRAWNSCVSARKRPRVYLTTQNTNYLRSQGFEITRLVSPAHL